MTATGIIRRIDDLGRIIIPKEIRKQFKIDTGQSFEIFIDKTNKMICFQKYDTDVVSNLKTQFMSLTEEEQKEFLTEIGVDI